jgi:predicted flap endonuclease-1-like 5' DNA nuclease
MMFDVQRTAIEQSQDAFKQSVDAQQEFVQSTMDFDTAKQMHGRSFEATHTMVDAYFDAIEATMPSNQTTALEDVRETMTEQLDALETNQSEALETFEATIHDANEITEQGLEAFVDALDEQIDAILEIHGEVETETLESVEALEGNLEELEAQITEIQHHIEDATDEIADSTEEMVEVQVEATGESLESLPGLGATYAERLQENGIQTLQTLTEANVDVIAEAADVSTKQAQTWIDAAQTAAK